MAITLNDQLVIDSATMANRGKYYCWVDYELVSYYQIEVTNERLAALLSIVTTILFCLGLLIIVTLTAKFMTVYLNRNRQITGPSNLAYLQRKVLQSLVQGGQDTLHNL